MPTKTKSVPNDVSCSIRNSNFVPREYKELLIIAMMFNKSVEVLVNKSVSKFGQFKKSLGYDSFLPVIPVIEFQYVIDY